MSAPERAAPTAREVVLARERQQCQAEGLRALASLVETDERISEILGNWLSELYHHLHGDDRREDLHYVITAAELAGAVLLKDRLVPGVIDGIVAWAVVGWSEHFTLGLQCFAPPAEPIDTAAP